MNAAALTHSEIRRVRNARCPRELGAVLAEVEPRLGREVTVGDLEELVTGHHGRSAPRKTTCRDGVEAVTALRAMLAAIDAQQGGAS